MVGIYHSVGSPQNTIGCIAINKDDKKEGRNSVGCTKGIKGVKYYAQPSMGVAVCPVTIDNNGARNVADTCYYIYKWIGSWWLPVDKTFEE